MTFAVMGNPIVHSLSPGIHKQFAQSVGLHLDYRAILVESDFELHVRHFFKAGGRGLNITAPYKIDAFNLSDIQTPRCQDAKAANTLWVQDGLIYADNTDGVGLCRSLSQHVHLAQARVLVIGAGGAVRGVINPLLNAGACVTITNRTLQKVHQLKDECLLNIDVIAFDEKSYDADVILNASSSDLDINQLPVFWLKNNPLCYDLAYHHARETSFVKWAKLHGCQAYDGFGMLLEQAAESFFIWHGVQVSPEERFKLASNYRFT